MVTLLDLKLHTGPGLEVFGRIRVHPSSKEEHDLATGYHLGAHSYIRKPVELPPPIQPPPIQDATL